MRTNGYLTLFQFAFSCQERLDILGKAGIPIWITEMDVLEHNETKRARDLEHIMRLAYGHPSVAGLVLWAFWSKSAWRGADTALIDDEFEVCIVYFVRVSFYDLLKVKP